MRGGAWIIAALSVSAAAQPAFEQRGFLDSQTLLFPQLTDNDRAHVVNQSLLRWDSSYRQSSWFRMKFSFDARLDSHRQVDRNAAVSFDDRRIQRPALNVREWSALFHKGIVSVEVGRQLIRWGRTDILPIVDRFTPRDYIMSVVNPELIGVNATRLTLAGRSNALDVVWQPWFTPSRTPLLDQRWTVLPPQAAGIPLADAGARYPGGSQVGARWNHTGGNLEYSLSYFRGRANLPLFELTSRPEASAVDVLRAYPTMQMYGGDANYQLPWLSLKAEAGYFTTQTTGAEEFVLYTIQAERQIKEVSLMGGYVGSAVTSSPGVPQFAPDRGIAKSVVGRVAWTIDVNRSLSLETAIRRQGSLVKVEYSQAFGRHWRLTPGFVWLRGDPSDFLGQYRRNSYFSVALRYSF